MVTFGLLIIAKIQYAIRGCFFFISGHSNGIYHRLCFTNQCRRTIYGFNWLISKQLDKRYSISLQLEGSNSAVKELWLKRWMCQVVWKNHTILLGTQPHNYITKHAFLDFKEYWLLNALHWFFRQLIYITISWIMAMIICPLEDIWMHISYKRYEKQVSTMLWKFKLQFRFYT